MRRSAANVLGEVSAYAGWRGPATNNGGGTLASLQDRLDEIAREAAHDLGIAGAQVAAWDGRTLTEAAVGMANVETGVAVTPDTLFTIGSTTKVFTAALVMQLVDEGRVDLDRPVVEQLPELRLADPEATRTVTPRHLMSMSSGIDNGSYDDHGRGSDAVARYVAALADEPMGFLPGRGYGYSNASTCVSGRLVEHVTGLDWDAALRQRLLEPAGLSQSWSLTEDIIHRRFAVGHTRATASTPAEVVHRWSLPRSLSPAGATLSCSAGDLVRFARIFLDGGVAPSGARVLSEGAVREMLTPQVLTPPILMADFWGLGPYGKTWDGKVVIGHTGTTPVGSSSLMWVPELGVALATIVNCREMGYPFAAAVQARLFPEAFGIRVPGKPKPVEGVPVDAARLLGTYEMHGTRIVVEASPGGIAARVASTIPDADAVGEASPLLALTPTSFLPTDPRIDGNRGWALVFLGPDDAPATHLMNGCFALRRVG